ncbi:MAG: hypothetical protein DRJ42_13675 [Deltaproteobacteria bacterium]|nr:MAG: hypothetical protein DRJ42_13675 [Deltaproteobacteria bacterium]
MPSPADACGGFFCGQQPVDQQAERIVFAVHESGDVTMITQIAYTGSAADFAWVLPLAAVPAVESLEIFPQLALAGLDAQTGPSFQMPSDCDGFFLDAAASGGGGSPSPEERGVEVHIRAEVGPYDVAVIESESPTALVEWLRTEGFRVTTAMEPYIRIYTDEGMKFLALKLQDDAETSDIAPFKFTLPGQAPSVPLRLTSIAAEPEMGIAVFILGDRRFGPAGGWTDVEIDDSEIVWRPYSWPVETNWAALVARGVDAADGRGFVTEYAGSTESYLELLRNSTPRDEEQETATNALLDLLGEHSYMTRLYTRLSPGEMTSDPMFRRVDGADVDRTRMLPRYVEGRDLCDWGGGGPMTDATTACDFASCGVGGLCREVASATEGGLALAGCACIPGTTARTTFDPTGRAITSCIDRRLSFLNPGDREAPGEAPLPDPCVGYACGAGSCVTMNMTPTCVCDFGSVAVGSLAEDGTRLTNCVAPITEVPSDFYNLRLPDRPFALPGGREVVVPEPTVLAGGGGCSSTGAPAPTSLAWIGLLSGMALVARRRRR